MESAIDDVTFTCNVCLETRRADEIGVVTHRIELAGGVPLTQNVRYCLDSPHCKRIAGVASLEGLALGQCRGELLEWRHKYAGAAEVWLWRTGVGALAAFVFGFVIRGAIGA